MSRASHVCLACPSLAKSCTIYGWLMLSLFSGQNYNKDIQGASTKGGCSDWRSAKTDKQCQEGGICTTAEASNAIANAEIGPWNDNSNSMRGVCQASAVSCYGTEHFI